MSIPEDSKGEIKHVFKKCTFQQLIVKQPSKKRAWKSLKQMIASEKTLPWPEGYVHYSSINAPPSFKPAEKFSDLSGLPSLYTDPQTRLRYANKEEYSMIMGLPMDITAGYLTLRGATNLVG